MNNITTTLTNLTNVTTITFEVEKIIIEIMFVIPIFLILILVVFYCDKENRTCIVKNNKIIPYNYIDNNNSLILNTSTNSE